MPEDQTRIPLKPLFWILAIALVLGSAYILFRDNFGGSTVRNFEECVAAGNPVMESYPEQCSNGDQTFVNTTQITQ